MLNVADEVVTHHPPGPSPGPPVHICSWIPRCLCLKLNIVVIYRPPGPLRDFSDEMDALLSCLLPWRQHTTDCPGRLQHPPRDAVLTWIHQLLHIWPHTLPFSTKPVFTISCSTSALSISPLTVSDHVVTFSLPLKFTTSLAPRPHTVKTHHNLKSLSPSALSSLPSTDQSSLLSTEQASSTLLFSAVHSTPDQHDPLPPFPGCLNFCKPEDRYYKQQRENEKITWWPCSLPLPPLWLHLNGISSQICLLPVKDQLLCL